MTNSLFPAQDYLCPLCNSALSLIDRTFKCNNNHSFDLAKEGYVNLLPVQFKHSKNPGDNKSMVNARRQFLEKGFYQPLADRLVALYQEYAVSDAPFFDAGCGEGFYTHQHKTLNNTVYGIDIAKEAVKKAAKKYQQCHFSVGTLSQLPFTDQFFGWMLSIYAPILEQEFTRVLQPNGYLLTVTPAEKHLVELKTLIYQQAQLHDEEKSPIKQLSLVHEEKLSYEMILPEGQDTLNLLSMTPFAFKATDTIKEQLANTTNFACQADFHIKLYKRDAAK